MKSEPDIASVAALIGDPARANILCALLDGRALTAAELAEIAGVGAPTASAHLSKLVEGGLLSVESQGRRRYFRLAGHGVAETLEALAALSAGRPAPKRRPGPREPEMRRLRSCYDHLAGEVAVALVERMTALGLLVEEERDFALTPAGETAFSDLGLDIAAVRRKRRAFARRCLDWSERRAHLGGALGAALLIRFDELAWVKRDRKARVVTLTTEGERGLARRFGLDLRTAAAA